GPQRRLRGVLGRRGAGHGPARLGRRPLPAHARRERSGLPAPGRTGRAPRLRRRARHPVRGVSHSRLYGPPPPGMPIPDRLNVALVPAASLSATVLLVLAGRLDGVARLLAAVVFSYVGLTGYALLHEAAHDNLYSDPRWNHALGVIAGLLFPAPFSAV